MYQATLTRGLMIGEKVDGVNKRVKRNVMIGQFSYHKLMFPKLVRHMKMNGLQVSLDKQD